MTQYDRKSRIHEEDADEPYRSPFEVDRDRVLHSFDFRRLAGITQAANASEGPQLHNRLTHSLKVAQVGRRLAQVLQKETSQEDIEACGGLDLDVVETACLAHDLGHPPFGHTAENVLQECLSQIEYLGRIEYSDKYLDHPDGFEGNAQTFRVVAKNSIRREKSGLNLTLATLNAVQKYPWARNDQERRPKSEKKWGFYSEEKEQFEIAQSILPNHRKGKQTLEASAMDLADDISYSGHDVDDFYRAGLIPLEQLLVQSTERTKFLNKYADRLSRYVDEGESPIEKAVEILDGIGFLGANLLLPFRNTLPQLQDLHKITSNRIKRFLGSSEAFKGKSFWIDSSVADAESQLIRSKKLDFEIRLLKLLMEHYVYHDNVLLAQQEGHRRVVRDSFETIAMHIQKDGMDGLVPCQFEAEAEKAKGNPFAAGRLAADIICHLDESQLLLFYQRISGLRPGALSERLGY